MNLRTVASTWYEAVQIGGYGCRLNGTYESKREVQKAIKEANVRAKDWGYKEEEYNIMLCHCVRMIEDNGDVVSETITKVRV